MGAAQLIQACTSLAMCTAHPHSWTRYAIEAGRCHWQRAIEHLNQKEREN
jgi:hypothetical protein